MPFHCLPYLPLRLILKFMDFQEILTLSVMSPNIRNAARQVSVAELKWLVPSEGHFVIHITPHDPNLPKTILKLNPNKEKLAKKVISMKCGLNLDEKIQAFENLSLILLKIVKPDRFRYEGAFFLDFMFNLTEKFPTFTLSNAVLSEDQARLLFESIQVDVFKFQNVGVIPSDGISCKFNLIHREMHLDCARWLGFESFLTMKCQKLNVGKGMGLVPKYRPQDFIEFRKTWLNGGMENLEEFTTFFKTEKSVPDMLPQLKNAAGLETVEWDVLRSAEVQRPDGKRAVFYFSTESFNFSLLNN